MENLLMFLATSLALRIRTPKFRRYLLGQTGCTALLPSGNNRLFIKYTKDGDRIYFNDSNIEAVGYGLICVQMKELYTMEQAETILVHYINQVKKPFSIVCNTAAEIEGTAGRLAITDYWQDAQGIDWKVKGYTDGKIVTVLYVKNVTETTVDEHDAFLNGFKFSRRH